MRPTRRWPKHACPLYLIYPWVPLCVERRRAQIGIGAALKQPSWLKRLWG